MRTGVPFTVVALAATVLAGSAASAAPPPAASAAASTEPAASVAATPQPVPKRWRGRIVTVLASEKIALTIDLGSGAQGLPSILATLERKNVPASFFITGRFARQNPQAVRDIAAAGHLIGNHSNTHPYFTQKSEERQRRQIRITNITMRDLTGITTKPWFRFPYGDYDAAAIAVANSMGYATIGWTVDSLGWQGTSGGRTKQSTRQRVVAAARPGAIVLMHGGAHPKDGSTLDADALPSIIRKLREKGYEFTELVTPGS